MTSFRIAAAAAALIAAAAGAAHAADATPVVIVNDATQPAAAAIVNTVSTTVTNDPRNPVQVSGTIGVSGGSVQVSNDPTAPLVTIPIADESHLITTQYCSADSTIFNPNLGLSTRFAGLVPSGKRLVIDYVSIYLTAPTGERGSAWVRAWNPLSAIKDEKHGRVFIPLTFQGTFDPLGIAPFAVMDGTSALRSFADEGWYIDVVFPTSANPKSGSWTCQATIMGHVVPKIPGMIVQNP